MSTGLRTRNAISGRMIEELHAVCDALEREPGLGILDAPGAHPVADDLTQAVLFEGQDKKDRMTRFLEKKGSGR
nr:MULTISPECIES: hypothetical protein [unclassified Streptomyces]